MAADTQAAHPVVAGDEKPTVEHTSSTDVDHVEGGEKPAQTYLPRSDEEYEVTFKVCSDNSLWALSLPFTYLKLRTDLGGRWYLGSELWNFLLDCTVFGSVSDNCGYHFGRPDTGSMVRSCVYGKRKSLQTANFTS